MNTDPIRLSCWQAASAGEMAYKNGLQITANPHLHQQRKEITNNAGKRTSEPTPFSAWNQGYTTARANQTRREGKLDRD